MSLDPNPSTGDTVRVFECADCGHRFRSTRRPMCCPDCGGATEAVGALETH